MKQTKNPGARNNAPARQQSASPRASTAASLAPPPYGIAQVDAAAGVSGPGGALPHAARIQAAFGPAHDVSSIRAHVGGAAAVAAARLGAEAYATGNQVAFARPPSLHTAAHEAAHVVQQRAGVQLLGGVGEADDTYERNADAVADRVVAGRSAADLLPEAGGGTGARVVQLRRLPSSKEILDLLADPEGANYEALRDGTIRLTHLAMDELTDADGPKVKKNVALLREDAEQRKVADLDSERQKLARMVAAIRFARPDLELGDPMLIDTGPRPGKADAKNLDALVASANAIFDDIALRADDDADLAQVFGPTNVAAAKAKYANGKTWMNKLHKANRIVTDRSGYNPEVGLGGLTSPKKQISLSPRFIDAPADVESTITMVHESMHAGNPDVRDKGYIRTQIFTQLSEAVKLTNAAHFEVVPRRILKAEHAFSGVTFTPAGAVPVGGGAATAALTPLQTAVREASEQLRTAWTMGLNLHNLYVDLYKDQTQWTKAQRGGSYRVGLPYWSKVEGLTIHRKGTLDPTSPDRALRPISQIDVALSEGVTRKLKACMDAIGQVPNDDAAATTFLEARAQAAEIDAAQATPVRHRDLWIKVALRIAGTVTGNEARDLRVVHRMVTGLAEWATVLQHRNPASFAD